jgi:hypothetical protein
VNCKRIRKNFLDYIERNLSKKDSLMLEQHIAKCDSCRQELAIFIKLPEFIHKVYYPPASIWNNFLPDLHALIEKEAAVDFAKEQKRQSYVKWGWTFVAVASVMFFVSSIILEYQSPYGTKGKNASQIKIQSRSTTVERSDSFFIAELISDTMIDEKEAVKLKKLVNNADYEAFAPTNYNPYYNLTEINVEPKHANENVIQSLLNDTYSQFDNSDSLERYNTDGLGTI